MNTYGLFSINIGTFNLNKQTPHFYPKYSRDKLVTFFKVHNLILNILGYISKTSRFSGCVRIGTGMTMCAVTLKMGERNATHGAIIGRWYDEALLTGIAHIARGILEAFVPNGWFINASLDAIFTVFNVIGSFTIGMIHASSLPGQNLPHKAPVYPFPLNLLNFV